MTASSWRQPTKLRLLLSTCLPFAEIISKFGKELVPSYIADRDQYGIVWNKGLRVTSDQGLTIQLFNVSRLGRNPRIRMYSKDEPGCLFSCQKAGL